MEYTNQYLANKVGKLDDKLKRIREICELHDINEELRLAMIKGVIDPTNNIHYYYEA